MPTNLKRFRSTIQLIIYEVNNLKDQNLINIPDTLFITILKTKAVVL